jgi:hypothetical protein
MRFLRWLCGLAGWVCGDVGVFGRVGVGEWGVWWGCGVDKLGGGGEG